MSEFIEYPKWIYHKTLPARIVESKEQHELFESPEWSDKPFIEDTPVVKGLEDHSVEELRAHAVKNGVSKKKAQSLSREEILNLFKGE